MGKPITEEGLKALKEYKYQSTGYSPLDNVFNHWWLFVVERVPKVSAKLSKDRRSQYADLHRNCALTNLCGSYSLL